MNILSSDNRWSRTWAYVILNFWWQIYTPVQSDYYFYVLNIGMVWHCAIRLPKIFAKSSLELYLNYQFNNIRELKQLKDSKMGKKQNVRSFVSEVITIKER